MFSERIWFSRIIGKLTLVVGMLFCANLVSAQDFHYSQFYNAPSTINPALTGIFNGDQRITASIRDQWRSVPVPWFNFTLAYDRKFYPRKAEKGFFAAGLSYNFDSQGDSNIRLNNINLSGSYTRILNERNLITIGGLVGYANRGFDQANLTWDRFWDPDRFIVDPIRGSGEPPLFTRFGFLETSLGLNYRWQKSSMTNLDLGIGGWHLTTPAARFNSGTTDDQSLPLRLSIYGTYSRELTDKLDLQLDALYQIQTTFDELVFGGYVNLYLNQNRGKELQLRLGVGYRTRKAVFPKLGIEYNNIFVAGSWDIYLLDTLSEVDHGGSGPELHFRYIIKHVRPLSKFKTCPIF